jgi:hypothetical protein
MQASGLTSEDQVSPPETQDEQEDNEDDNIELADGITEIHDFKTNDTVTTPPTKKFKGDCNIEAEASDNDDIIKLQKPGVQLTVFHYNILPVVGNVYKVNSNYHLEKVKYHSGQLYLCDDDGLLHKAQYVPYQLYQADSLGCLRAIGKVDGPISNP